MSSKTTNIITFAFGLGIIVLSQILGATFPKEIAWMPEGFSSPIIAFEFLQSNKEVIDFFGVEGTQRAEWVQSFLKGHQYDNIYLIIYSFFLIFWAIKAAKNTENKAFYFLIPLALHAGFCDWMENQQLDAISTQLSTLEFTPELNKLFIFTWLKWGSLAIALAILGGSLVKKNILGKVLAVLGAITLVLGFLAFFNRSVVTNFFVLGITGQFVLLIVLAGIDVFKKTVNDK